MLSVSFPTGMRVWTTMTVVVSAVLVGATVAASERLLVPGAVAMAMLLAIIMMAPQPRAVRSASEVNDGPFVRPARITLYAGLLFASATIFRPVGPLTISDILLGAAGAFVALDALSRSRRLRDGTTDWMAVGGGLLAFGGIASSLGSASQATSLLVVARILAVVIGFSWIARATLIDSTAIKRAVWCWCIGAAAGGFAAALSASTGYVFPGSTATLGRYMGLSQHVNELGAICAISLVPSIYLAVEGGRSRIGRLAGATVFAGVLAGLILSGSVNALVAASLAAIAWMALIQIKPRTIASVVIAVAVGVGLAISLVPSDTDTPWSRLHLAGAGTDTSGGTLAIRLESVQDARARISEDPLTGVGFADAGTANGHDVHNLLLQAWYEGGLLAFLGLSIVLVTLAVRAKRLVAYSRHGHGGPVDRGLVSTLTASFIAFLIYGMAAILLYKRFAWIAPALLSAVYGVHLQAIARSHEPVMNTTYQPSRID